MQPRARTIAVTIYACVAALLAAVWLRDAILSVDHMIHAGPIDGSIDWIGARAFIEHINPFSPEGLQHYAIVQYGFGHPPTTPFWFLPLASRWGIFDMAIVFGYLTLVILMVHLVVIVYELGFPSPPATVALLFAAVVATPWFQSHLQLAQLSEGIALLYVLAWYFLRRDRQWLGGVMLGLATTLKLFPGLMVAWLLVTRRFAAFAAACIAWLVVATVMTARYGLVAWPQFFRMQGPLANKWVGNVHDISLQGIVQRMFRPACHGWATLAPAATVVAVVLTIALVGGAWWLGRSASRTRLDLPFCLFSILSWFVNPWAWDHYDTMLILPALVCVMATWRAARLGMPRLLVAAAAVALVIVACALDVDRHAVDVFIDEYGAHRSAALHFKLHLWEALLWLPTVLLMALLAVLLWWQERDGEARRLIPAPRA